MKKIMHAIDETFDITFDFSEWKGSISISKTFGQLNFDAMDYTNITAFMLSPIAVHAGVPIYAKTVVIPDLQEFIDYCANTDNKIYLYMITYSEFDNAPPYWRVRFGEI